MRIWISAMLLASTAALGAPALAQVPPPPHDGGDHHDGDRGGDHRGGGGGDHGNRGGQPQGQPQAQAPQQRPQQGGPGGARVPGGQPGFGQPGQPQGGRADPRFRGGPGFQGDRGPGNDPRQNGHAGGDPRGNPGWDNRPGDGRRRDQGGDFGRPVVNDGHARDRAVYRDGRPGYQDGRSGYGRPGDGGRPGGYDRRRVDNGGGWSRGWRDDDRYDWQGWRNQHRDIYRGGSYRAPRGYGYGYRRYDVGVAIAPAFFAQQYWIANPQYYRLPPAYGPYRWVRYYNDALLIDLRSGFVVDAIPGFFW